MKTRKDSLVSIFTKLAAMSDREIARLLRKPEMRPRWRLPSRRQRAPAWTLAEKQFLGKWPDQSVASYLGRTLKSVQRQRQKLRLIKQVHIPWTPEEIRLLDPAAAKGPVRQWTRQLAKMLGRSVISVREKRKLKYGPLQQRLAWTAREISLLGKRPDREIAALRGRSQACVYLKRKSLGIPSYRSSHRRQWTSTQDKLLGTATDDALAKKFRCDYYDVKRRRHALGIKPFSHRRWTPRRRSSSALCPIRKWRGARAGRCCLSGTGGGRSICLPSTPISGPGRMPKTGCCSHCPLKRRRGGCRAR